MRLILSNIIKINRKDHQNSAGCVCVHGDTGENMQGLCSIFNSAMFILVTWIIEFGKEMMGIQLNHIQGSSIMVPGIFWNSKENAESLLQKEEAEV